MNNSSLALTLSSDLLQPSLPEGQRKYEEKLWVDQAASPGRHGPVGGALDQEPRGSVCSSDATFMCYFWKVIASYRNFVSYLITGKNESRDL